MFNQYDEWTTKHGKTISKLKTTSLNLNYLLLLYCSNIIIMLHYIELKIHYCIL